ncbi:MAG: tRNA epoxyqueuosine(34) reductase QueG [Pseudomonadota bacterium]|nr:tRNA epoxyqueuosine(34) reductase QueG [Pseudomonadota bacterium]
MPTSISDVEEAIKAEARRLGFDACGIAALDDAGEAAGNLAAFLAAGYHGDMDWLAATGGRRGNPRALWPEARTALLLGMNYGPTLDPLARLAERSTGNISVYALGSDYHGLIKGKLKHLAAKLAAMTGAEVKVFVDTAPLMEKPLAQRAGIGWQGKHTNLVSRELGSWLFLGAILTAARLEPDAPEVDHCGSCRACLDICPTRAFPQANVLDARRCISYLTIEHKGHIAPEFRKPMGNRIYGCDDCLAVCPWNKFASAGREAKLQARADLAAPDLAELLALEEEDFRKRFAGTSIRRTGRDRFVRNTLIAAGNSGDLRLKAPVIARLADRSALVRAMAVWALSQLAPAGEVAAARADHEPREDDPFVRQEWGESARPASARTVSRMVSSAPGVDSR